MKAIIERLSEELSGRYLFYIERIMVDVTSKGRQIEFRCGFALRSDHVLRAKTFHVWADALRTDAHGEVFLEAIFRQLEILIDLAIAEADLLN